MEIGQDNGRPPGAGTRIIGQVAGHKIHLEIEDVLDKIKYYDECTRNLFIAPIACNDMYILKYNFYKL